MEKLNDREIATVLAALRYWQRDQAPAFPLARDEVEERIEEQFLGHFADEEPLDQSEIDELCERLNLGAVRVE